jgi:hypothetical protein
MSDSKLPPDVRPRLRRWGLIGLLLAVPSACDRAGAPASTRDASHASRQEQQPAPLTDADATGPFVVTMQQSYFGQNDYLITLRSDDRSGELVLSPQDSVVCGEKPIGRFRFTLPDTFFSRLATALPTAPEPEDAFHVEGDSTAVVIIVKRGAWARRFVHFRRDWQGVRPEEQKAFDELERLVEDARNQIELHPAEVIELHAAQHNGRLFLEIHNVGLKPVRFAHPLHVVGGDTVGKFFGEADPKDPIAFADRPDADPPPVTLAPGQQLSLRAGPVPRVADGGAVWAQWNSPGQAAEEEGVFRATGCMKVAVP